MSDITKAKKLKWEKPEINKIKAEKEGGNSQSMDG